MNKRPAFCAHCAVVFLQRDRIVTVEGLPWHRTCAWMQLLRHLDTLLDRDGYATKRDLRESAA